MVSLKVQSLTLASPPPIGWVRKTRSGVFSTQAEKVSRRVLASDMLGCSLCVVPQTVSIRSIYWEGRELID